MVRAAWQSLVRPTCGRTGSRWNVRFGHQRGPTGRGWGRGWPRGRRGQRVNRPEHTPKKCDGCEDNFTALKLISKVFLFDDETYFSHILTEKFLFSKSKIEVSVSKASVLVLEQVGCLYQQWTLSTWTDISGNAFRWQKQTFDAFNVFYCWCDFVVPSDKFNMAISCLLLPYQGNAGKIQNDPGWHWDAKVKRALLTPWQMSVICTNLRTLFFWKLDHCSCPVEKGEEIEEEQLIQAHFRISNFHLITRHLPWNTIAFPQQLPCSTILIQTYLTVPLCQWHF